MMASRDGHLDKPDPTTTESVSSPLLGTELATEIEFLAARARAIGTRIANRGLHPLELTVRSYSVLALACSEHAPSQRELAEFLSLDASQIVALVDDLQRRALVVRSADPRDRRSNSIASTAIGRELYARARQAVQQAENESLAGLSPDEKETLRTLLRKVAFAGG
jgi:DNA-binding MarR family transcriptional regulator